MFAEHINFVRGNGQVLGVGLCANCGKLIGFNPASVPTVEDQPLCRECIYGTVNPARGEAGKDEIVVDADAYEACKEADLPEHEAPLAVLRERLAAFKDAYEMCQYIDHYPDVVRCRELNMVHIKRLQTRIAELEGQDDAA